MKKLLFGLLGLLVTISGWSAETNSGPISSVTVAGLVTQNGTPTPNTPMDIVSNNGVLKVSKNLFDKDQTPYQSRNYISSATVGQTGFSTTPNNRYNVYRIEVQPNTTYTFGKIKANTPYWVVVDSSDKVLQTAQNGGGTEGVDITITTATSAKYLYLTVGVNDVYKCDDILQLERGSTATPYMPYGQIYTDGEVETIADSANHTATVATLLGVGDYRDTQNINTGAITRNVGVKVLDGTEIWGLNNNRFRVQGLVPVSESNVMACSHFAFTGNLTTDNSIYRATESAWLQIRYDTANNDVTAFKAWLAAQYNAGTPVIIVYPLATATTESVAGQTMTTAPVNNRTGGVTGMTITTLLSSGASVVTTIATNAIKIATTAYNSARFSPVVNDLNSTIATIRDVVTNTINQTKAIADLQATKQTRPDENCPAGKKCLLVETEENGVIVPHWYEIIESAD